MSVVGMHPSAQAINPYRDTHPGYLIIKVGNQYEVKQLTLILSNDAKQRRITEQLNVLNDALSLGADLKAKKEVDEVKLRDSIDALNREFPDLNFHDFLATHADFTEEDWDRAEEKITRKQQELLRHFNPLMAELDQLIGDKNRVHEIIAEIIRLLNEGTSYIVRKTGGG
jgi:hypothetical protein